MGALNFHCLFFGAEGKDGFLGHISITAAERDLLVRCRDAARTALREGFRALNAQGPTGRARLLEWRYMPLAAAEGFRLTPRFRMQGSFAYHTVNHPAWLPPQEVDVDDGTYLPTSFVARTTPVVAAAAFFATAEGILAPLCEREGWEMDRASRRASG